MANLIKNCSLWSFLFPAAEQIAVSKDDKLWRTGKKHAYNAYNWDTVKCKYRYINKRVLLMPYDKHAAVA
jgi:hypothetical protein